MGDEALPLHQQVFLLWLELVLRRRNTAVAGTAAGAAVIGGSS
jgi:cyanophycinase-like exopeptidase